jgi:gluconokinase
VKLHVIVVMGVSGAGKTLVGKALSVALDWQFYDADDFHSAGNVAKMHRGEGLSDADRAPWLDALSKLIARVVRAADCAVLACSALTHAYREEFRHAVPNSDAVRFVYLDVPESVLRERLRSRPRHFAPLALLDSQLATLEPPRDAFRVDGTRSVGEIVREIEAAFALQS